MQVPKEFNSLSDDEKLRHWLDFYVPRGYYGGIKKRMAVECLVSMPTFYNWMYGRCRITEAGKRDINRITQEVSGFEIYELVKPEGISVGVCGSPSGDTIN
ncbi:MAG: hypothetical protein ACI304_09095 [Lepagella sp.]